MNAGIERDVQLTSTTPWPQDKAPGASAGRLASWSDPIRVLFVAVNDAQGELRLDEEHRVIRKSLERQPGRFAFDSLFAVRIGELGGDLSRRSPDILHFGGHGTRAGELTFHGETGAFSSISTDGLKSLLHALRGNIKLAVLNACFSMHQAKSVCDATGIAIGMRRQISDLSAVAFARGLYGAIADARSVHDAFELGRAEISISGRPEDANVPELFVRPGIDPSQIHVPRAAARPYGPSGPTISRGVVILILVLVMVGLGLTSLASARWLRPASDGEFAIKVKFVDEARQPVKLTGRARLESDAYTPTVLVDNSDLAEFEQVPRRLDGSHARFTVDSHAFRVVSPVRRYQLEANGIIYLELQPIVAKISGTVSLDGERLPGGQISLAGYSCSGAIRDGYFEIPCAEVRLPVKAQVREPDTYTKRVCRREIMLREPTNNEIVLAACAPPAPSPPPPLMCARSPEELIQREAELVRRQDLNGIVGLFAPGAMIRDVQTGVRRSPRARYRAELATHHFVAASHADIQCAPTDGRIWLCTSSSAGSFDDRTGYSNPPGSDRWMLEVQGGCWRIRSLAINAVGNPSDP